MPMMCRAAGHELELVPAPVSAPSMPRIENELWKAENITDCENENKQLAQQTKIWIVAIRNYPKLKLSSHKM